MQKPQGYDFQQVITAGCGVSIRRVFVIEDALTATFLRPGAFGNWRVLEP
jgi:hypothetical protein